MAYMQITEVKGHRVHFLFQKLNFDKTMAFFFIFSALILNKAAQKSSYFILDVYKFQMMHTWGWI